MCHLTVTVQTQIQNKKRKKKNKKIKQKHISHKIYKKKQNSEFLVCYEIYAYFLSVTVAMIIWYFVFEMINRCTNYFTLIPKIPNKFYENQTIKHKKSNLEMIKSTNDNENHNINEYNDEIPYLSFETQQQKQNQQIKTISANTPIKTEQSLVNNSIQKMENTNTNDALIPLNQPLRDRNKIYWFDIYFEISIQIILLFFVLHSFYFVSYIASSFRTTFYESYFIELYLGVFAWLSITRLISIAYVA